MFKTNSRYFLRLLLGRNELGSLPEQAENVRVCSGQAWVSVAGRDYVVGPGEIVRLPASRYPTLISAVRNQTALVEVQYRRKLSKVRLPNLLTSAKP